MLHVKRPIRANVVASVPKSTLVLVVRLALLFISKLGGRFMFAVF